MKTAILAFVLAASLTGCAGTATLSLPLYKSENYGAAYLDAKIRYEPPASGIIGLPNDGKLFIEPTR